MAALEHGLILAGRKVGNANGIARIALFLILIREFEAMPYWAKNEASDDECSESEHDDFYHRVTSISSGEFGVKVSILLMKNRT